MSEFDLLFASVWRGEAPAEVLADYILENVDGGEMKASYLYLNEDRSDPDWAYLTVRKFLSGHLWVRVATRNRDTTVTMSCGRDQFADGFTQWLMRHLDYLDTVHLL